MIEPSPISACLWGVMCFLSLLQLGTLILRGGNLIERLALGWLAAMLLSFLVMGIGENGGVVLVILGWVLAVWWFRNQLRVLREGGWERLKLKCIKADKGMGFLWALAFSLVLVRLVFALLPLNNWDSLNHHLPLLLSRLQEGGWEPMFWVSTERRTPLFSMLPKLWAISLDPTGRALVVQHLCLGIAILLGMGEVIRKRWPSLIWALPLMMIWSLSDVWRHIISAGDEVWLILGAMAFLTLLWKEEHKNSKPVLLGCALMASLGIKATAIFFLIPFGLAWLILTRHQPKKIMVGLALGLGLVTMAMSFNLWHYSLAYPANRWSDLLAKPSPKVMTVEEVKEQRFAMGLDHHRDNQRPGSKGLSSLMNNVSRLPSLALGPYLIWLMVCFVLMGGWKARLWNREGLALGMALLAVFLGMISWNFSPQAMFRYFLPMWWVILLAVGILIQKMMSRRWVGVGVGLVMFFALSLEGRELVKGFRGDLAWSPEAQWLKRNHDGPLISAWREESKEKGRAFYIGSLSVLMVDDEKHWLAQIGNEVGWRQPDDVKDFLKREKIIWWILSRQADQLDPLYRKLTEGLVDEGVLESVKTVESGVIYRTELSSD